MSSSQEINLDPSVLLNYVYSNLPGDIERDKGCQRPVDSSSYHCVIGSKASGEFDAACERRFELYDDLLDWLEENPETSIYEYDPTKRPVHTSSNDLKHIRYDVLHEWAEEPRRKQLSDIRRCQQDLGVFHEQVPDDLLDRVYANLDGNEPLLDALHGLSLGHDKEIIVDAVEICRVDSIDHLVAVDSDITDSRQIEAINEVIRNVEEEGLVLEISRAGDL
jgi:hypothetical protein